MKQEILARVDIYDYIGRFVSLNPKGKDQYIGLCPFHNEKTPSFSVSVEKRFFHCFGCKASGDVVKFVMLYDNLEYEKAIEKLAAEVGIKLGSQNGFINPNQVYLDINAKFADLCHEILRDQSFYYGIDYLKSRQLKDNIIDRYQLGYLPSNKGEEVFKKLREEFSQEAIFKSGLFKLGTGDKPYCQFGGRIIFPIPDSSNKIVGFGSRVITDNAKPKYLNSADSDFFHKSELLYGLNKLHGDKMLKETKTVFVVEGYMDVISLANHGITNCVGVLGANFQTNQLKKLWVLTDRPTVCFDNDSAGTAAMKRIARIAVKVIEPGKSISFLKLHGCKDPDEFVKKHGSDHFLQNFRENRMSLAEYLYEIESYGLSLKDPDEVVVFRQRLAKISDEIANDVLRNEYKRHFNKVFYNKQSFKNDFKKIQQHEENLNFISTPVKNDCNEEKICQMISENSFLLMNNEILDDFMSCKFKSHIAEKMRLELTKDIDIKHVERKGQDVEKGIKRLILSIKIRDVEEEITKLSQKEANFNFDTQLIQLKKYEIQLKEKLSSTLI